MYFEACFLHSVGVQVLVGVLVMTWALARTSRYRAK